MSIEVIGYGVLGFLMGVLIAIVAFKKVPRKLKQTRFESEWKKLQVYCRDKKTWPEALLAADKLLDRALKRRRFKGKTMGERLVSAQRIFTDNDDIWEAHNLAKKINSKKVQAKLTEYDVKEALISFREALKDLGALPNVKQRDN